jgi:hypothetical protein
MAVQYPQSAAACWRMPLTLLYQQGGLLVSLLISCSLLLAAALHQASFANVALEYRATLTYESAIAFPALQMHQPTKEGNVPHIQPEEETGPTNPPKVKLDPAQLQHEAQELLDLSQSVKLDIASLNQGLRPKDTAEKLKRIQKLAKHLRSEIGP